MQRHQHQKPFTSHLRPCLVGFTSIHMY
jgi:hypothetical protein